MLVSDVADGVTAIKDLKVLILVLVDVGLGHVGNFTQRPGETGLNPCFSGCWSRTRVDEDDTVVEWHVLILVLVDVGLGHSIDTNELKFFQCSLNPCFSGCWSRTLLFLLPL